MKKRVFGSLLGALAGLPAVVSASSVSIANPSFHDSLGPAPVGYGTPAGWNSTAGGVGVNPIDNGAGAPGGSPFSSGAVVPDGADYALIQGPGNLSQTVTGLDTSKEYWLQFHAAGRNCCGGVGTLTVSYAGQTLVPETVMNPVPGGAPYEFFQVSFSPVAAMGELLFTTGTSVGGDHTVFLDAVSMIQRNPNELVIANPSFEASGTVAAFPGYQNPIAGWNYAATSGNVGVNNSAGPFFNNGTNPDGANAGFIQQQGTLSQMVAGFEVGKVYELLYSYNNRQGFVDPILRAAIGGIEAQNSVVTAAGAGNPFHSNSFEFTANATEMMLEFSNLRAGPDDSTLVIDDVHIRLIPEPSAAVLALAGLLLGLRRRR